MKRLHLQRLHPSTTARAIWNRHQGRRWEQLRIPQSVPIISLYLLLALLLLADEPHSRHLRLGLAVLHAVGDQPACKGA